MTTHFGTGLPTTAPIIDPQTEPYWEGARRGALVLPWCLDCGLAFWYPRGFCPRCGGTGLEWRPATGHGRIHSWTIVRRAGGVWSAHTPFVLALVELAEGVVVQGNVIDIDAGDLTVGASVVACFESTEPENPPVLRFRWSA